MKKRLFAWILTIAMTVSLLPLNVWAAYDGPNDHFRYWWPVYWDFDKNSDIEDPSVVTVTANGQDIYYADGIVSAKTALTEGSAIVEDAIHGIRVELAEGYYVKQYRMVCGNHYDCAVTPYKESIVTGNTDGDYTSTLYFVPDSTIGSGTNDFDHGALPSSHPLNAPDPDGKNLHIYDNSGNILYPSYLMLEISEDPNYYDISYDWGTLDGLLTEDVPYGEEDVRNGHEHEVEAPAEAALDEAAAAGYTFIGWEIVSAGFADDIIVEPGDEVAIHRADILFVAQWEEIEEYPVIYIYEGDVPAGRVPPTEEIYRIGTEVIVEDIPMVPAGYTFDGWYSSDADVESGSFAMPAGEVEIIGIWSIDHSQVRTLSYTVEYYFNFVHDPDEDRTVEKSVWIGADTLPVDAEEDGIIRTFAGWEFHGLTDPEILPDEIEDGGIIKVYYTKADPKIELDKSVDRSKANVGDVISYTIAVTNTGGDAEDAVIVMDASNGAGQIENIRVDGVPIAADRYEHRTEVYNGSTVWVDAFTVDIPAGETVYITYDYEILPADGGKTLKNVAFHSDGTDDNSDDSTVTEVEEQYELVVYHYADGTLVGAMTETFDLNDGEDWKVMESGSGLTYQIPETLTYGGKNYVYLSGAAEGTIHGADVQVDLHYALDAIGGGGDGEDPDTIPDKYQATILYRAETGGTITGLKKEVVTILDGGDYATHGKTTLSGSTAAPEPGAFFEERWTWGLEGHAQTDVPGLITLSVGPMESPTVLQAEKTYVLTACFEIEVKGLEIHKKVNATSADVGDPLLYEVHVRNTGNVDLYDVKVTDVMSHAAGTIELVSMSAGITFDAGTSTFTLSVVPAGDILYMEYRYIVQRADAGKIIENTVITNIPDETEDLTDEVEVEIEDTYTVTYVIEDPTLGVAVPVDDTDYIAGETVTLRNVTAPAGYDFSGWTPAPSVTIEDGRFTMPAADVLLTGRFLRHTELEVTKTTSYINGQPYTIGDTVQPGDVLTWTITVRNLGDQPGEFTLIEQLADTVVYSDAALLHPVAPTDKLEIAGNGINTYYAVYTVKDTDRGGIVNTVTVAGENTRSDDGTETPVLTVEEKTVRTINGQPVDVESGKVTTPALVGDTIQWTVTIRNTGKTAGTFDVTQLKDIVKYKDGSSWMPFTGSDAAVTWSTDTVTVPAEGTAEVTVTWTVPQTAYGKTIQNFLEDDGTDETDPTPVPSEEIEVGAAELTIRKAVTALYGDDKTNKLTIESGKVTSPALVGDTIEWIITVENRGEADGVFTLTDRLEGADGKTRTVTLTPAPAADTPIRAGETLVYTAVYTLTAEDRDTVLTNSAAVTEPGKTDPTDKDEAEDVPTETSEANVILKKWVEKVGDKAMTDMQGEPVVPKADVGDTIVWRIEVSNFGTKNAIITRLADQLKVGHETFGLQIRKLDGTPVDESETFVVQPYTSLLFEASHTVADDEAGAVLTNYAVADWTDDPSGLDDPEDTEEAEAPDVEVHSGMGDGGEEDDDDGDDPTPSLNKKDHVAYIIGYPDGTVRPQNNITRAEVATIFFRLLDEESREYYWSKTNSFTDVAMTDWYNNAISTLANADIITGYPDGSFCPDRPITRAEFAAIAARFSEVVYNGGNHFNDVAENHWAARFIALAEYLGWVEGYPDGSFKPDQAITRAESMTLINRVLERAVEEKDMLRGMAEWIDNKPGAWYYETVQEATNSHEYERHGRKVDGQDYAYERWTRILEAPDWAALEKSWSEAGDE